MYQLASVFLLCLMLQGFVGGARGQTDFRGIVPFVSTRKQVEQKLGKPNKLGRYELREGRVNIVYRDAKCDDGNQSCSCTLAIDTVLFIRLQPNNEIEIASLRLDEKVWEKRVILEHGKVVADAFSNRKLGVTYEVENGVITAIMYRESGEVCKKTTASHLIPLTMK